MATIIYDLETSGFKGLPTMSKVHKILQISAHCLETDKVFNAFVNPDYNYIIPQRSSKIHNIYKYDVDGADTIHNVMKKLYKFFEFEKYDTVEMIAHNNQYFDELVLMKEGVDVPPNVVFWDSLPWLRLTYPSLKSYSLSDLYEIFFEEKFENAHRADADVLALSRIYRERIAPRRNDDDISERRLLFNMINNECLTSIRFMGSFRAGLCYKTGGIETVSQLKEFAKRFAFMGDMRGFDRWLKNSIRIRDITERMFIISAAYEVPVWADDIRQYLEIDHSDDGCLNEVEYYVKYRYMLNERAPNSQVYHRGLIKAYNGHS